MDPRIAEAFDAVPREAFLPAHERANADLDRPIRLSHGQTNSQPSTVRNMLGLLNPQPGDRVLDVGAGSGWTTALLAHLVGPGGRVWGVERIPELQEGASSAVVHWPWAEVRLAHAEVLGLPEHGAFDRILVSAEARREVPEELVAQLAIGGVMVIPVRGQMLRVVRREAGDPEITRHGWYTFVPLVTP